MGAVCQRAAAGTVREDYSADGEAWNYLPHDQARSRAYRWGEDGLAGFCDVEQRLCLGLALWNGRDPILKERAFGLTGAEANHGEDVKEYWWYLDATPSHSWNRWRYHYPQAAFPYEDLRAENSRRGKLDPEYELLDTGVFDDDRYWITEVHYAKADPTDVLMSIRVTNAGPEADTLHVLPTAWFRNTWSWDADAPKPVLSGAGGSAVTVEHPFLGSLELLAGDRNRIGALFTWWFAFTRDIRRERTFTTQQIETMRDVYTTPLGPSQPAAIPPAAAPQAPAELPSAAAHPRDGSPGGETRAPAG